ncbi:diguanylate cyclase [uncultured Photobacterium sp.]|uniref:diguanylate cyclase n=1 Tax=uncultured Photobacterium sp. TaxID=173973 RepID=UPI00262763C9|nr:diguanylate cyclase [uncultured Photobacterium sp.]
MFSKLSKNLGLRIQLILTLFVLLTATPIGLLWYHSSEQVRLTTVEKLYRYSSKTIQTQLNNFFAEAKLVYQHQQRIHTQLPEIVQNREQLLSHIENVLNHHFNIDYYYFANNKGGLLSLGQGENRNFVRLESQHNKAGPLLSYESQFDGRDLKVIDRIKYYDARQREWYQRAVKTNQPIWSDIYPGAVDKNMLGITLSKALRDENNQVLGVWGVDLTLSRVVHELQKTKPSKNSTVALLNANGDILASSDPKHGPQHGKLLNVDSDHAPLLGQLWPAINHNAKHRDNVIEPFTYKGEPWLNYYSHYPLGKNNSVTIVFYSPLTDLTQDLLQAKHYAIIITVLMITLAIYYGSAATHYILTPIRKLTQATEQISQGKWTHKIRLERDDEVGQLAKSFNNMTEHLETTISQLDNQKQETERLNTLLEKQNLKLEERVKARTEELSAVNARLRQLADFDPLTGIANRRHFWEMFAQKIEDTHGWLLILDIDNFKQLNDAYGHMTGDQALQHFTQCCEASLGGNDFIGRIGGEEFAIWSEAKGLSEIKALTEQIFSVLKNAPLHAVGNQIQLTASIGGTDGYPGKVNCYAIADSMLYKAKQAGKNRAVIDSNENHS